MDKAKIRLSPEEAELVVNADWILTKNHILQKVRSMLEDLQSEQQQFLLSNGSVLPAEVMHTSPKISRGENYKGLPYLVLDHPRYFGKDDHFAIRSMFWWGNFFSITLHVSGNNKNDLLKNLTGNVSLLAKNDFYIYTGTKEWEHDIDPGSYKKLSAINEDELQKIFSANNFLKLAIKFPIDSLEAIEDKLLRNYELLVKCCC